ncbi:MAG: hypothetical protein JXB15_12655, partial [Anaerolineales bacterium]|nr:hypothetical protein [Anaerolineales bacterium]
MDNHKITAISRLTWRRSMALLSLAALFILGIMLYRYNTAQAVGGLTVQIIAGDNLVVDSNAQSPSTYAPSVATVAGKFCNENPSTTLYNVWGYIGDYTSGTAGIYPVRNSGSFSSSHPLLYDAAPPTTDYAFTHLGGSTGTTDAKRFIGTLEPGQCSVQYWSFVYPHCEDNGALPCSQDVVWGVATDPLDDLWLNFDIWGVAEGGAADNQTKKMTMRNEISAMANKIEPNPNGAWFNTKDNIVMPGSVITSNGIRYELGNVNKGFDNNNDGLYDYNAWMQPFGDTTYDPSCFRLIRTTGVLTVTRSGGNPPIIYNFTDKLYFTYPDIPPDNTGVIGNIYYTFLALNGPCSTAMTPYQEVASGADNEKFNADYGTSLPAIGTEQNKVVIDKASQPNVIAVGGTVTYTIGFANNDTELSAGLTLSSGGVNLPVVISDTVPVGAEFVGGSAETAFTSGCPSCTATIRVSTDGGATWGAEPTSNVLSTAANKVIIQWWLDQPLPATATGYARYKAYLPVSPAYSYPAIINEACGSFGEAPPFDCDTETNLVSADNTLGDLVWTDTNGDGIKDTGESGLNGVTVKLYWDKNGDGELDDGDVYYGSTDSYNDATFGSGYYQFSDLPDGNFIAILDMTDAQIPTGYSTSTPLSYAVALDPTGGNDLAVSNTTSDFGLAPTLKIDKIRTSSSPVNEGGLVTYDILLTNTRPGDGTPQGACTYTVWGTAQDTNTHGETGTTPWTLDTGWPGGAPDGTYAISEWANNKDTDGMTGFNIGPQGGLISGSSVKMLISFYIVATNGDTDGPIEDDTSTFRIWYNDGATALGSTTYSTQMNSYEGRVRQGLLIWDVSSLSPGGNGWDWSDFASSILDVQFQNLKVGQGDYVRMYVDAVGFRFSTNQTCGGVDDIIATLPLTDTFDANRLQFISASPLQTSLSGGTITWSNLGPLYPGQTKTVSLTFLAKPVGDASVTTINYANVTNAKFTSGRAVNNANDNASVTISPLARIGDYVWFDSDADGVQDSNEVGIPGVTVRRSPDCKNNYVTTTTDANGYYEFSGLANGTYCIDVVTTSLPGGATGWTNTFDRDGNRNNEVPNLVINLGDGITTNDDYLDVDFGYDSSTQSMITGRVWEDNNANGQVDSGEASFSGVSVQLYNCGPDGICGNGDDVAVGSPVTTDANGYYCFTGVTATGNHYVKVTTASGPLVGYTNVYDPDGNNDSDNSESPINIAAGNSYGPYNFGYRRTGSLTIGDELYVDWNGDGNRDTGEEGIANVTVKLYEDVDKDGVIDPEDALIATTATDSTGAYSFTGLAGEATNGYGYIVVVDTGDPQYPFNDATLFPGGVVQTQDPDQAGVVCTTCDNTASVILMSTSTSAIDWGYQPTGYGSIGDRVWNDLDADGQQDLGESGLSGVTVRLYEDSNGNGVYDAADDALIAETTTASDGSYSFTGLPAGDYLVDVVRPTGYTLTTDNDPEPVTLTANQSYTDADFGYIRNTVIGDFIWKDLNGNGIQETAETGINGVVVELYQDLNEDGDFDDSGEYIGSQTTANDPVTGKAGYYQFSDLPAGDYKVVVADSNFASGGALYQYQQTGDPDASDVPCLTTGSYPCNNAYLIVNPNAGAYGLNLGQINLTADFGYVYLPTGSIGDTLWIDSDGNNVRDEGEAGISGVTVDLYDCSVSPCTFVRTDTTDSNGQYLFESLSAGKTYEVRVNINTSNYTPQYDPDGTLDNTTQVVLDSSGQATSVGGVACLAGEICNLDADFSYLPKGTNSTSGTVFFDVGNNGGLYDSSTDTPIGNVTVYLWQCTDGTCASKTLFATTVTGLDGSYSFTDLPDGYYQVIVPGAEPEIYGLQLNYDPDLVSPDVYCDSGDGCDYRTITPNLSSGSSDSGNDFGLFANMDCGDLPDTFNLNPTQYKTSLAVGGPCHISNNGSSDPDHYLGVLWDSDDDGNPSTSNATWDDTDSEDDEDGIYLLSPPANWAAGNTVQIRAIVVGSNAYLAGWFDWNVDGDFVNPSTGLYDTGEYVYFGNLAAGTRDLSLAIPNTTDSHFCVAPTPCILNARLRLYKGSSPPPVIAPTGLVSNGENEDYQWPLGPTAVTLSGFTATSTYGQIAIQWQTVLEQDVWGFNVYRSTNPEGP